ncbi:hypothetical protein ABIB09_000694 [Bradyrhizobium sp. RT3a]
MRLAKGLFAAMTKKTIIAVAGLVLMTVAASAQSPLADAQQCSEAALNSYALSSAEPAEKIAEIAFQKCAERWRKAFEPVGQQMDANPAVREAQETCIKKIGCIVLPSAAAVNCPFDGRRTTDVPKRRCDRSLRYSRHGRRKIASARKATEHCERNDEPMKDYQASLEKLRRDAAEAALIRDLATNPTKRNTFDRLAQHLSQLADGVEKAMAQASRGAGI